MIRHRTTYAMAMFVFVAGFAANARAIELHVSPTGDDASPGTADLPLRTLEAARDALRRAGSDKGGTVWLHGGRYERSATFSLERRDSGTLDHPVVYRAADDAEVVLDGGRIISSSAFGPVTDPQVLSRLLPDVRGKMVQADLKKLGVSDFGSFGPRGFGRATFPTPPELFVDGQPMRIGQWPNPGQPWIPIGEVLDKGSVPRHGDRSNKPGIFRYETPRAERWSKAQDLYITGFFAWGYAEDTVKIAKINTERGTFTTVQPHLYGYGGGSQKNLWQWYAINLLEEIDLPGEYFLDRESGVVYLYPPGNLSGSCIQLSRLDEPFITMTDAAHIRFENIIFENARSDGIRMSGATGNTVAGCALRNLGGRAISVSGTGNAVLSCDVFGMGSGGVSVSGGDRKSLTPAGNVLRNCDIHHLNRWYRNYQPCVSVAGVGNVVEHNHLHHCPGQAVTLSGNDHRIEYNEIDHVVSEMSDQGGIYMGATLPTPATFSVSTSFITRPVTTSRVTATRVSFLTTAIAVSMFSATCSTRPVSTEP